MQIASLKFHDKKDFYSPYRKTDTPITTAEINRYKALNQIDVPHTVIYTDVLDTWA